MRWLCLASMAVSVGGWSAKIYANTAEAPHAMVVSANPIATGAGVDALKSGGNAIDAAVAVAVTLGVVDGANSGIGGGCFMLIRTANGKIVALDGREMAPAKASRDMYLRNGHADASLSQTGALAVGIPGSLAVYDYVESHFGKHTLADALRPAADVAERGYAIDASYAHKLAGVAEQINSFPETKRILMNADGSPRKAGDTLRQPDLAKTYRAIADGGADVFYKGAFAKAVGEWMAQHGGIVTADDFGNYTIKQREPLRSTYRGRTIIGFPPPSSGGVHVAQILNELESFDLKPMDEPTRVHVVAEAMRRAFADRAYWLGDPDFVRVPTGLLDRNYAGSIAKTIDLQRASEKIEHGTPPKADEEVFGKHTTQIAVADDAGNWVALTTTVNTAFGSKVIVPGTGVILNNQMDDFSIEPGVANHFGLVGGDANAIAPGKRPLSSMSPTIVLDASDKPVMTIGAAGGPKIITQVLLVLSNVIDLGDDLPTAMARPRFHHQWSPDVLWIENTFAASTREKLKAMGHTLDVADPVGATQAIEAKPAGGFIGVSEPRSAGLADGE